MLIILSYISYYPLLDTVALTLAEIKIELGQETVCLCLRVSPRLQTSWLENYWELWTQVHLTARQHLNSHLSLYLEFAAASTGRGDGSIKANSGILPGITESEALKVFAGQPADLLQQSRNNLRTKGMCQSLHKVWIRLVSTIVRCN